MCLLSISAQTEKKSGNLFNDPRNPHKPNNNPKELIKFYKIAIDRLFERTLLQH